MNRLVINTANNDLLIALEKEGKVFSLLEKENKHHNEILLPKIDELLKENDLQISNINEFGVVVGPGSFTGIRVGIASIKAFRDALNIKAKGINNLKYLFKLAQKQYPEIEIVAILGSFNSYFVARKIHDIVYIYERNLSLEELKDISKGKSIGMFYKDENLNCVVVENDAQILFECLNESEDFELVPVYYQLSQAENDKLKRGEIKIEKAQINGLQNLLKLETENILVNTLNKEQITKAINDKNYLTFVAKFNEEIIGFIITQISDEINIDSLVVDKHYRNLGIATKLIEEVETQAKKLKVCTISLEVNYKNITAFLLYEKLGFTTRRIRKKYYSDGNDCIEMIKEI